VLTKKQLQALVGCGEKEDCTGETCPMFEICDNDYTNKVAAEAAKTALAYREMLERLEFSNLTWDGAECAICGGRNEHEDGCELAALLKGLEGSE
jgi:hypothetical protein